MPRNATKKRKNDKKNHPSSFTKYCFDLLRGVLVSAAVSIVLILAFALIIKITSISAEYISIINQIIKVFSVFICVWFAVKADSKPSIIKGTLSGICYIVVGFLVLSLAMGEMGSWPILLSDCGLGAISGGLFALMLSIFRTKNVKASRNA